MARPSLLSDDLRDRIESEVADGVPVVVAAQNAHVGKSTLHEWLSKGLVVRRRPRDPLKVVRDGPAFFTRGATVSP